MGFREFAEAAIAERRASPRDDLMSVLVHAEVDGDRLDDESIIHESLLILIGGDETTRHVISGGLYQLLVNPGGATEARSTTRRSIPTAVEEMLRWVSPIRNMNRTVTADTVLGGARPVGGREGPAPLPVGQPRRGRVRRSVPIRRRATSERARRVRVRQPLLPREQPGPARAGRACSSICCARLPDIELVDGR